MVLTGLTLEVARYVLVTPELRLGAQTTLSVAGVAHWCISRCNGADYRADWLGCLAALYGGGGRCRPQYFFTAVGNPLNVIQELVHEDHPS